MSVKIPVTRVKKSQQAPPAVSPVTTIFYPGDWNFLRTHLASSFIIVFAQNVYGASGHMKMLCYVAVKRNISYLKLKMSSIGFKNY